MTPISLHPPSRHRHRPILWHQFHRFRPSRISYYFRKTFNFTGDPAITTLRISRYIDDGYLLYLNGQPIDRKNLNGTPPLAWTDRPGNILDATAENDLILTVPFGALVTGTNQLAAEVHQPNTTSADILFAIKLDSITTTTIPGTPTPSRKPQSPHRLPPHHRSHVDPANGTDFEFVELRNLSPDKTLDLTGIRFTEGITFTFPASTLAPGAYILVIKGLASFRSIYGPGPVVAGVYPTNSTTAAKPSPSACPCLDRCHPALRLWTGMVRGSGLGSSLGMRARHRLCPPPPSNGQPLGPPPPTTAAPPPASTP